MAAPKKKPAPPESRFPATIKGEHVRAARERLAKRRNKPVRQLDLAVEVELWPDMISNIERNSREVMANVPVRLADALDVSTDYLLGRTTTPEPVEELVLRIHQLEVQVAELEIALKKAARK